MAKRIVPLIMCGGAGTRLWPASRENRPKQFLSLFGNRSTFQDTLTRVGDSALFDRPIVITNALYRFMVREQLDEIERDADILLEPCRRDSGPAIAAGAAFAAIRDPQAVVLALAADHVVSDEAAFVEACRQAVEVAASGRIVTFGIKPERAATEYGYIQIGEKIAGEVSSVAKFVEKPDEATATTYVRDGFLWNSGNFMFPATLLLDEYRKEDAASVDAVSSADANAGRDLGSWDAVWKVSDKDAGQNAILGDATLSNTTNSFVLSEKAHVAVEGLDDVAVIATEDAVFVGKLSEAQKVGAMVKALRLKPDTQGITEIHRTAYRPWGGYSSILNGARFQVKRLFVKPGKKLSLQKHQHRAEHWVVVSGTAEVTIDGTQHVLSENESIYLPLGCVHRLANPGKILLEVIEVQTGSYLGEDDIIRIEDEFGRA